MPVHVQEGRITQQLRCVCRADQMVKKDPPGRLSVPTRSFKSPWVRNKMSNRQGDESAAWLVLMLEKNLSPAVNGRRLPKKPQTPDGGMQSEDRSNPMTERERYFRALFSGEKFSGEEGSRISNVKFFLGDLKYITQEKIYKQAAKALTQFKLGAPRLNKSGDSDITRVHIDQFLAK